jgi:aspartate/methionine/tyrosine aminotransferase
VESQGKKVIYLQVGQPSTGAPQSALESLQRASHESALGYTGAAGIKPLRQRIARSYDERYGVEVDPNRIVITFGASGAMILALISSFEQGARVALPQPFYYAYRFAMPTVGIECVPFYPSMETDFQPTVADLEAIDGEIDGLIVGSPGNPTGSIIPPDQFAEVADYCQRKNIRLISDEIYHNVVYDEDVQQSTALSFSDEAIVINSFSKYYSMPGWRLGWMVVPEYLSTPIAHLAHNLYISPPNPSQEVALATMDCTEELDEHVARYKRNRDIILREMPRLGFDKFTAPHGAFYLYCHVQHLEEDSVKFCIDMLEGCAVLASPGTDFAPRDGHHYVRFSYAGSTEDIEEAMRRIGEWRGIAPAT